MFSIVGQFNPAFFLETEQQGESDENGGAALKKDALYHLNKLVKSPRARDQYSNADFSFAGHMLIPPLEPHVHQMQLNDAEIEQLFGEPPKLRCACLHQNSYCSGCGA